MTNILERYAIMGMEKREEVNIQACSDSTWPPLVVAWPVGVSFPDLKGKDSRAL